VAQSGVRLNIVPTHPEWLDAVMADFDAFLRDHASCEKKASGMALSIASHYPDKPVLLNAMADLAVEELGHYREVVRLLTARGIAPGPDTRDAYVRTLNDLIRRGPEKFLLDRLLVAAVVERRGHERFGLVAEALPAGDEKRFFEAITKSEGRHWQLFIDLARSHCDPDAVDARLAELVEAEGAIVSRLPFRAGLH
jgi:tRNA-(ms[2]io[6]A)-hydroxylase